MRCAVLIGAALLAVAATDRAALAVSSADVGRTIAMVFAGDPGAAGGDVNADGWATAADVGGTVLGLRSPTQPGPFGVGVQQITFTKASETKPDQPRPLQTVIWYPTTLGAGPIDRKLGGVVNAPLAAGTAALPLLLFSHGSCGMPTQSLFLTPLLASYGLIVAAPPHPGNQLQDFPNCSTPAEQVDSFLNRVADITFVLDSLLQLNEDSGSFVYRAIDASRAGMSGHSFGGQTTLRVCALDQRVIAGLALAPALAPIQAVVPSIRVPMMVQDGELDTLTPFTANAQATYDLLRSPRALLEIFETGHFAFSDGCFPGFSDCGPNTLTQDQAHLYVLRYAVPFVLHWLAGDDRFDAFLAPAVTPPGARFTADPTTHIVLLH